MATERSTVDRLEILEAARICAGLTVGSFQLSKDLGEGYFGTKHASVRKELARRIVEESVPNAAAFSMALATELEALFGVDAGHKFRQLPRYGSAGKGAAEVIAAVFRQANETTPLTSDHLVIVDRWVARIIAGATDALGQLHELDELITKAAEQRDA